MVESEGRLRGYSCLPDDCAILCAVADSLVVELVKRIVSGEVTMKEFEKVMNKKNQVEKLCSASQEYTLDFFQQEFRKREAEYLAFRERRSVLSSFCREMEAANVNVEGYYVLLVSTCGNSTACCLLNQEACCSPLLYLASLLPPPPTHP